MQRVLSFSCSPPPSLEYSRRRRHVLDHADVLLRLAARCLQPPADLRERLPLHSPRLLPSSAVCAARGRVHPRHPQVVRQPAHLRAATGQHPAGPAPHAGAGSLLLQQGGRRARLQGAVVQVQLIHQPPEDEHGQQVHSAAAAAAAPSKQPMNMKRMKTPRRRSSGPQACVRRRT